MSDDTPETFELFGETFSQCQTCGQAMVGASPTCNKCAGKVAKSELRELIEEWREIGTDKLDHSQVNVEVAHGRRMVMCADELEALLDE